MKTLRPPIFVATVLCWSLATVAVLAQQFVNPTPAATARPPAPRASSQTDSRAPRQITTMAWAQLKEDVNFNLWTSPEQMNNYYTDKFIQSAGFGGVRMTVPTMSLDPLFRLMLGREVSLDGLKLTAVETYKIEELDLIGIAKHETPVAFVTNRHSGFLVNQPRQNVPSRWSAKQTIAGTRDLTDFEKTALTQIKEEKAVTQVTDADGTLRIVGAVRAQQACLECHGNYKAGDALGAFSYRLVKVSLPTSPNTPTPAEKISVASIVAP